MPFLALDECFLQINRTGVKRNRCRSCCWLSAIGTNQMKTALAKITLQHIPKTVTAPSRMNSSSRWRKCCAAILCSTQYAHYLRGTMATTEKDVTTAKHTRNPAMRLSIDAIWMDALDAAVSIYKERVKFLHSTVKARFSHPKHDRL